MRTHLAVSLAVLANTAVAQVAAPLLEIEREVFASGGAAHSLAWSPDGRWIASGGECGDVLIVDAETGRVVHEIEATDHWIGCLAFSPDGCWLAAIGRDLSVWDTVLGKVHKRVATERRACEWKADGSGIVYSASRGVRNTLEVRDSSNANEPGDSVALRVVGEDEGTTTRSAAEPARNVPRVTIDPMFGSSLAEDKQLALAWNDKRVVGRSADGRRFTIEGEGPAAAYRDRVWVRAAAGDLWVYRDAELMRRLPLPHRCPSSHGALTADGRYAALSGRKRPVTLVDLANGEKLAVPAALRGVPLPYAAGPELVVWHQPRGHEAEGRLSWWMPDAIRRGVDEPIRAMSLRDRHGGDRTPVLSRDGRFIGLGGGVFDLLDEGRECWSVEDTWVELHPADGGQRAVRVDLAYLIGKSASLALATPDAECQCEQPRVPLRPGAVSAALSPDGTRVLWVSAGKMQILAAEDLAELHCERGDWDEGIWVDDRRFLLSDRGSPSLELWTRGALLGSVALPSSARRLAVDRDGRRALAVLRDRAVIVRIAPPAR